MAMQRSFASLVAALALAGSSCVEAEDYHLRTIPPVPQAGAAFVVAFDSLPCEVWMLLGDAEPPAITVDGNLVTLSVDRITVFDCSNTSYTNTVAVPALPMGTYQFELIARAYQSPGNDILAQSLSLVVGPAVSVRPQRVPAVGVAGLAVLAAGLGWLAMRRGR